MTCRRIETASGVFAIACSREPSRKCSSCGTYTKNGILCDYPLKNGKTCDRHCCRACATNVGPNLDYCPPHQRHAQGQTMQMSSDYSSHTTTPRLPPARGTRTTPKKASNNMAIVQPQSMTDLFNGIKGAKVLQRSKSMESGFEGKVRIKKIEAQNTRNGPKLFVKYDVVESNDPDQWPAGLERTWKQAFTTSAGPEPALNNMLAFVVACAGIKADDEDEIEKFKDTAIELLKEGIQSPEQNALIDVVVGLATNSVKTKEGRDFMTHVWSPATP